MSQPHSATITVAGGPHQAQMSWIRRDMTNTHLPTNFILN